ncbi:MAG: hypothetical protein FJY47_02720 [Betaproteobacteria bacterium]|nr:hypothetical protein [Betaproteobacteria bacterium]MBM3354736.1 hypothetical protein [Betaproteobacteria bacterium]
MSGHHPDLPDRLLVALVGGAAFAIAAWFTLLRPFAPEAWHTPGSPELYLAGVAGAGLLLVSVAFLIVKRSGRGHAAPAWFVAHVVCACAGAVLVAVHSGGFLRRPPALLLLALLGLAVLGVWARVRLSARMAATFGSKERGFRVTPAVDRAALADLISRKRAVLAALDPAANEATFSPSLAHWVRAPWLTLAYLRLVREENRLVGTRASVGMDQAWWRPLHLALAALLVIGLLIHVVTVTFFAGYVADGGPITWWHLRAW